MTGAAPRCELGLAAAAGLTGAVGVALTAVAAHRVESPALGTAGLLLILHAGAALSVGAWSARQTSETALWRIAAGLLLLGPLLFAADITARNVLGSRLLPMAAPAGGLTMIGGWLLVSVASLRALRRAKP